MRAMINRITQRLVEIQVFRFAVVGALSAFLETGLLIFFVEIAGISYLWGNGVAFLITNLFNFILSRTWVFERGSKAIHNQAILFYIIVLVGLGFNQAIMYLLVEYATMDYRIAKIVALIVVVFWNFFGKKKLVFEN